MRCCDFEILDFQVGSFPNALDYREEVREGDGCRIVIYIIMLGEAQLGNSIFAFDSQRKKAARERL